MNVKVSFQMSYIILYTTAIITFIESIRTDKPLLRHIFNLETCVSLVSGYFYGLFLEKLKYFEEAGKKIDWREMTLLRYMDWSITTPMMLITLCASLSYNIKKPVYFFPVFLVIVLNYVMLGFGYLGEIDTLDKITAATSSFVAFFGMFGLIYYYFLCPKYHYMNQVLYAVFMFVWSLYGVVYFFEEEVKNICLNILDVLSKCLVGLGLWMYFTNVVT